ncbi:hypothetical protein ANN_12925 [Periplaneta americana]|uniref:Uncharacterized protein n=1 Tax=Periplaneta americana TaxID=6978 RepID=A0ABQ8THY4_PERAM|nr:hypothetical protein ANN_12925 [Periplaneta americana]
MAGLSHLNAIDLARDRTRNLGHRRPALYQLANQVDNAGELSPGSSTDSYPAFAHIGLRENHARNLNQMRLQDSIRNTDIRRRSAMQNAVMLAQRLKWKWADMRVKLTAVGEAMPRPCGTHILRKGAEDVQEEVVRRFSERD